MFTAIEAAEKLMVSKVTIYNKLKKHDDMVVIKQGKKYITQELLSLIKQELKVNENETDRLTSADLDEGLGKEIPKQLSGLVKQNDILIDTLLKQLETKDKQISDLQNIIRENNKLIENNQILLKNAQQQDPLLLEEHFNELDKKIEDITVKMQHRKKEENHKNFWNIFKHGK